MRGLRGSLRLSQGLSQRWGVWQGQRQGGGTRDERGLGTRGLGCGVQGRGCPSEVDPLCLFFVFCPLSSSHASTYVIDMTSSEGMRV